MLKIRKGVFETNSSSTHTICICKDAVKPDHVIHLKREEFGWEKALADPVNYLYALAHCFDEVETLKSKLNDLGIEFIEEDTDKNYDDWDWYVDHYSDARELFDDLMDDDDFLIRYLFGKTKIYTYNDNDYPDPRAYVDRDEDGYGGKYPEQADNNYCTYYKGN